MNTLSRISGVYDRMGSLATIDPQYDIAISTAASSFMRHILVDNVNVAEKCVEKLRRNNLPPESFLCRD